MIRTILYLIAPLVVLFSFKANAQYMVEDFRKEGMTDTETIQAAMDFIEDKQHGKLEFDGTKNYQITASIELPRTAKGMVILEGNGAQLFGSKKVNIFNRVPSDQKEATAMMSTRFIIQNFKFFGGDKGINLGATYGSKIENCNFNKHKEAAIDIQFGLMTSIENCLSSMCSKDNFVLRHGIDWGGNGYNSQSNHSHIKSCRVFAKKGAFSSFKVIKCGGVTLEDIISEGQSDIQYAVYVENKGSIARIFNIKNFHIEHIPSEAGIYLGFDGLVTIDGVFYQAAKENFPIIKSTQKSGRNVLENIPHYVKGSIIQNQGHLWGIYWIFENCNRKFYLEENWKRKDEKGNWIKGFPKAHFNKN